MASVGLYLPGDAERLSTVIPLTRLPVEKYRSPFRKDYARLIHCAAFRRLQGKTQLFPGNDSDFFRNRLTHSLEVAQVAKSIAIKLNDQYPYFRQNPIDTDLIELAALAHDLGHPPFGHNGEKALDDCMKSYGGFEGNAQTLRILARLEKKHYYEGIGFKNGRDKRSGLNLTLRSLAAILKYDRRIPPKRNAEAGLVKGYYATEDDVVRRVRKAMSRGSASVPVRTIECEIMDVSDDIAYSTYDLEDALKAGFMSLLDLISARDELYERVAKTCTGRLGRRITVDDVIEVLYGLLASQGLFDPDTLGLNGLGKKVLLDARNIATIGSSVHQGASQLREVGYFRTEFTSYLVGKFIRGVGAAVDTKRPHLSRVQLDPTVELEIEALKVFTYENQIMSPRLRLLEYRGYDIVSFIFRALADEMRGGFQLMPDDFRQLYRSAPSKALRMRTICDFIAGMTDHYAVEFYARLQSENPMTVFKPH